LQERAPIFTPEAASARSERRVPDRRAVVARAANKVRFNIYDLTIRVPRKPFVAQINI
jgi:hypothetical protein